MSSEPVRWQAAKDLLSRAHSPPTAAAVFADKVQHKPLLLRPTSPDPSSQDARAARRRKRLWAKHHTIRKQKPQPLSAKQKRQLGIFEIPKQQQKYELFLRLHELWIGYMREILGLDRDDGHDKVVTVNNAGLLLASADYHGALIEVVRCRCVGRVGTKGIVVKDTKFTFEVVTKQDTLKVLPKEHTVFKFEIPAAVTRDTASDAEQGESGGGEKRPLCFELHGFQFKNRAVDRANKKFKQQRLDDL